MFCNTTPSEKKPRDWWSRAHFLVVPSVLRAAPPLTMVKNGRGDGGKKGGGGKGRANKDHRLHCSVRTIHKHRWDDICAEELKAENYEGVLAQKTQLDADKPGLGQHYCVACRSVPAPWPSTPAAPHHTSATRSRYYISEKALEEHQASAKHKRRLKTLTTQPVYNHAEANAAAGRAPPDNGLPRPQATMDQCR